ncbi:hypothetical protein B0H12DRAFT_473040 [Mycena haematopus]|nr:hypothetical protein B0H12DRAFT_473040 [Mycena haematopus]
MDEGVERRHVAPACTWKLFAHYSIRLPEPRRSISTPTSAYCTPYSESSSYARRGSSRSHARTLPTAFFCFRSALFRVRSPSDRTWTTYANVTRIISPRSDSCSWGSIVFSEDTVGIRTSLPYGPPSSVFLSRASSCRRPPPPRFSRVFEATSCHLRSSHRLYLRVKVPLLKHPPYQRRRTCAASACRTAPPSTSLAFRSTPSSSTVCAPPRHPSACTCRVGVPLLKYSPHRYDARVLSIRMRVPTSSKSALHVLRFPSVAARPLAIPSSRRLPRLPPYSACFLQRSTIGVPIGAVEDLRSLSCTRLASSPGDLLTGAGVLRWSENDNARVRVAWNTLTGKTGARARVRAGPPQPQAEAIVERKSTRRRRWRDRPSRGVRCGGGAEAWLRVDVTVEK